TCCSVSFFFQAEDGIRDGHVTGVQTCALPISSPSFLASGDEGAAFAKKLGDARKIVVSNQDLQFTWRNSELLKGDLVDAVAALKIGRASCRESGWTAVAASGVWRNSGR